MNQEPLKTSLPVEGKIEIALRSLYPEMKPNLISRYVSKYVSVVIENIAQSIMLHGIGDTNELSWSMDTITNSIGRNKSGHGPLYIFDLMDEHPSTKLVEVTYIGNNLTGRVSRIVFNPMYKKDIMDKLKSMIVELDPKRLKEIEDNSNVNIPVDKQALISYIKATRTTLEGSMSDKKREAITRCLLIANQLLAMVKEEDGFCYVKEQYQTINSGRMYGKGLSLQRIPKRVRHAALGHCYIYDFQACSYAIFASLAKKLNPNIKVAALTDYVKYRKAQRTRIANDVGIDEDRIKDVFISMGFGAQVKDNPHNSIRHDLGKTAYDRLLANHEFSLIKRQLDDAVSLIHKTYPDDTFELCGRTYTNVVEDGTKLTKSQKMAWIFQCVESYCIEMFTNCIEQAPILLVHDCAYYKNKVPLSQLQDAKYKIQQEYEYLTFDQEEIYPIQSQEDYVSPAEQEEARILAHNEQIYAEELKAKNYAPSFATMGNKKPKKQVITPWGLMDEELYKPHQTKQHTEQYYKD